MPLACSFTSHGFSPVLVPFHPLAEQRWNWRDLGPLGAREHSLPGGSSGTADGKAPLCPQRSSSCRAWSVLSTVYVGDQGPDLHGDLMLSGSGECPVCLQCLEHCDR
jgi:hypothetical protein